MRVSFAILLLASSLCCNDNHEITQSAVEQTEHTINCEHIIGTESDANVHSNRTIVGDVVAFPLGELQEPVGPDLDFGQLFAKTGLVVRADSAFELLVPAGSTTRIHWGNRGEPVQRIIVPACGGTNAWVAFAGGFWVDEATCVEIIVRRLDQEDAIARIGVGVPCEVE